MRDGTQAENFHVSLLKRSVSDCAIIQPIPSMLSKNENPGFNQLRSLKPQDQPREDYWSPKSKEVPPGLQ